MKTRRMAVFFALMILGFAGCTLGVRRAQGIRRSPAGGAGSEYLDLTNR